MTGPMPDPSYGKPEGQTAPPASGPSVEDTRPNRPARAGRAPARRAETAVARAELAWAGVALVVLVFCGISAILVLPPLLNPLPGQLPGYEITAFQGAAATMVPGDDLLLETHEGKVAVYVPQGAYAGHATLVLLPRPVELTPAGLEKAVQRFDAVDVSLAGPDGQPLFGQTFKRPILVCYLLNGLLKAKHEADPLSVTVQSYAEGASTGVWVDLPQAPGWLPGQVCGTVTHLSLFALAVRTPAEPKSVPTPAWEYLELYGVPPQ